jgi:hypothetical protein
MPLTKPTLMLILSDEKISTSRSFPARYSDNKKIELYKNLTLG